MRLRIRLDVFGAALLSSLGLLPLGGCSGSVDDNVNSSLECKQSEFDPATGMASCEGSWRHRVQEVACTSKLPRPQQITGAKGSPLPPDNTVSECTSDADCTAKPHGFCQTDWQFRGRPVCHYGCLTDADCGAGQLCECGSDIGQCVATDCKTDADCGPGLLCRSSYPGCGPAFFRCQSPEDECASDLDCGGNSQGCQFDETKQHFACSGRSVCGRPFLVEGGERLADASARRDWQDIELSPNVSRLNAALTARLAEEWTRVGLMEHASIAAFARFNLQLLSCGAPAELIERSTAAIADETRHAKACFALASAYAKRPIGPGPLAVSGSLDELELEQIVVTTIREGCIGETLAAIEAREAAEHASDPVVRDVSQRISQDEARHAELAWAFVKWALMSSGAKLWSVVRDEFATQLSASHAEEIVLSASDRDLLACGILPEATRSMLRSRALREVVRPCAEALLEHVASAELPADDVSGVQHA